MIMCSGDRPQRSIDIVKPTKETFVPMVSPLLEQSNTSCTVSYLPANLGENNKIIMNSLCLAGDHNNRQYVEINEYLKTENASETFTSHEYLNIHGSPYFFFLQAKQV